MAEISKKELCKCTHCGNEAEMTFTCTLNDGHTHDSDAGAEPSPPARATKVKGTATCSHCGNEADMWIDI